MLINIDPILSPELLHALRSMGHGDKLVLADANFPSATLAKKLIRAAKNTGADAVKFQNFSADKLSTKNAKKAPYQIKNTKNNESQYLMLKGLELKQKDYFKLKKYY